MHLLFVLFNADNADPQMLSKDSLLRIKAATLFAKKSIADIFFVGGGGLSPSGAERMLLHWKNGVPESSARAAVLGQSNTTVTNLREIRNQLSLSFDQTLDSVSIITSDYHLLRVQKIARSLGLSSVTVLSAEGIILQSRETSEKEKKEIRHYMQSWSYQKKIWREHMLICLQSLDRLFHFFRKFQYKAKV